MVIFETFCIKIQLECSWNFLALKKMKAKIMFVLAGVGRIEYSHNTTGSNPLLTVRLNSLEYPRTPPGQLKLTDRHFLLQFLKIGISENCLLIISVVRSKKFLISSTLEKFISWDLRDDPFWADWAYIIGAAIKNLRSLKNSDKANYADSPTRLTEFQLHNTKTEDNLA